ncbi:winged helix-turn-helix transcriptional regulator [Bacillaceae bacterium SIJ1]|uniref:MarR family winged helix-turn-helix transcriptional regulator n=1 Tax=Litoribacterium kuwaitense TaxID=1398745 RepID=UPI0013ED2181|nr:MarR family winged helix-turn-helix transcriptional regulator [Litoribacterium kuwaitense]NGP46761.1 winged helix-turn-helix transcriptional regulator [Litoribacterium kuwaitense]
MSQLDQSYGFLLGKVLQQMEQQFAETLIPFHIDARQYGVLLFIQENSYSSQKEISEKMRIDRTTMVSHVDHLEALELVERTKNPNDRRAYSLIITEKGARVLVNCWEFLTRTEAEVLSPLGQKDQQLLKDMLLNIWRHHKQ